MTTLTKAQTDKPIHTNALIHEASPYLLQHAHNPVDWMPWGDEAFEKATKENKPIFLSVGYAACHWCHVMEHESFENDSIAEFMNQNFVPIKVDREERPDIDHFYMQAVQQMTGGGGWPMSVFLTPDKKPFYGGTYWPPSAKFGRPGFWDVLHSIAEAWKTQQSDILDSAEKFHGGLQQLVNISTSQGELNKGILEKAVRSSEKRFDETYGGFGEAPKFPHAMELGLLLRLSQRLDNKRALEMVTKSLDKMALGGIYDQVGGGFHRYSTDAEWLVPHFEKMLYDNALLIPIYLDAYLVARNEEYKRVARESLDWALREMEMPEGGFASSLDADAEGEEGKFYVWTAEEIISVLGKERGEKFCQVYEVTSQGNFEQGKSILNVPRLTSPLKEFEQDRIFLLTEREKRVRPARDDKVLTDWNGFMISTLVRGYSVLGDEKYLSSAKKTANRLLAPFEQNRKLVHSHLGERTQESQLLLDYSALGNGLLDLFLTDGDIRWFNGATNLAKKTDELFFTKEGPYRLSADSVAGEIAIDFYDNAMPSGVAMAGNLTAKLYFLTGDNWYLNACEKQTKPLAGYLGKFPEGFTQSLVTVDMLLNPPAELVLVGDANQELWKTAQQNYFSNLMILNAPKQESTIPDALKSLLDGKTALDNKPTAYLCVNFACDFPVNTIEELRQKLATLAKK